MFDSTPIRRPVLTLITGWRLLRLPTAPQVMGFREALFSAILEEIRILSAAGISYDPSADYRVTWATQWLAVAEGQRPRVDTKLRDIVDFMCVDCPISGQHHAAGELQPLTLGS